MDTVADPEVRSWAPGRWARFGWLPIPTLLVAIAALWVADLRMVWQAPLLFWLTTTGSAVFAIAFIVLPASRQFLARGQLSVLLLGCGVLVVQLGVFAGAVGLHHSMNAGFTIFTVSALFSGLCHFVGVTLVFRNGSIHRPAPWLAGAYVGWIAVMGLVIGGALTSREPLFFSGILGMTILRSLVEGVAAVLFILTACLLWTAYRRSPSPFFYWYALGLGLLAASLVGHLLIAVGNSPLQWVARFTHALGTAYLCAAVLIGSKDWPARSLPLEKLEGLWQDPPFLAHLHRDSLPGWVLRYLLAVAGVAAAFGAHQQLAAAFGPGLPPYVLFYPVVMMAAVLGGIGPGLMATVLTAVTVACRILQPIGRLVVPSAMDRLGLALFFAMGILISLGAELLRRYRDKVAAYDYQKIMADTVADLQEQSQRLYRTIGESIDFGIWVCAPDGRQTYASDSFLKLVGLTQEQCADFGWGTVLHPDERERVIAAWRDCVRTGAAWDMEHRYRGVDGQWHHVLARGLPVRDEHGQITSWAGINLDIDRLKQMEQRLQQEAVRKDEFIALLGHELRNPLVPNGNAVYLMRQAGLDPALMESACAIVERQLAHIVRLVDDLLDVTRIARGKVQLKNEVFDLVALVRGVLQDYQPVLADNRLTLKSSLASEPILMDGDRTRMIQSVSNLLHNACKFSDPGGEVRVAVDLGEPGWGQVTVQDTGVGIPADWLATIFEPFMQHQETIGRTRGGLGLGLAMTKGLAELHGGTLSVRSDGPGKGAEFTLRLPVVRLEPLSP